MAKDKNIKFDYVFDGKLNERSIHDCLIELVKYVMYIRYQIPLPIVTLQNQYAKEEEKWKCAPLCRVNSKSYQSWCKLSNFMRNFCQISHSLSDIIERFNVLKIIVAFGSTIISPKESIIINNYIEADKTNDKLKNGEISSECRNFMKSFITSDSLNGLPTIAPKRIFILICTDIPFPQSSASDIFLPRHNFKEPHRGAIHTFNLRSKQFDSELVTAKPIVEQHESKEDGYVTSTLEGNTGNWYLASLPLQGFK